MKNSCPPDDLLEFWVYLNQTTFAIAKAGERELQRHGLSDIQNKVILTLKFLDHEPTLGELSHWLFREHNAGSDITKRMERKGLIRKYQDPVKKNSTRIALTEKGKKAYLASSERKSLLNILSLISQEECLQFKALLEKLLLKAIDEADLKYKSNYPQLMKLLRKVLLATDK